VAGGVYSSKGMAFSSRYLDAEMKWMFGCGSEFRKTDICGCNISKVGALQEENGCEVSCCRKHGHQRSNVEGGRLNEGALISEDQRLKQEGLLACWATSTSVTEGS
jgi:hypothetical protein